MFPPLGERADSWRFDVALIHEYRAIMEQAAKKLGQLKDRVELSGETLVRQYIGVDAL